MLFIILVFIFNASFADINGYHKFDPLKYFGNSDHMTHIQKAQSSTNNLYKTLSMFYKDYYEYGNTTNNVISSTKFKRPDLYSHSSKKLNESFEDFKKNLPYLQTESSLRLRVLELYKLPEILNLPLKQQELYVNKKKEFYLLVQNHFSLVQQLSERSVQAMQVIEPLTEFNTEIKNQPIKHQPLSDIKRTQLEKVISEMPLLQRALIDIELSAKRLHQAALQIEIQYKRELGKNFGFHKTADFNELKYRHVDRHLFEMYESIKSDIQVNNLADNPFVVKRYLNQLKNVVKKIDAILTFSYSELPEYEYKALKDLSEHLKQKSRRLDIDQSLYSLVGFMARYYSPEMNYHAAGNKCNILFQ